MCNSVGQIPMLATRNVSKNSSQTSTYRCARARLLNGGTRLIAATGAAVGHASTTLISPWPSSCNSAVLRCRMALATTASIAPKSMSATAAGYSGLAWHTRRVATIPGADLDEGALQ